MAKIEAHTLRSVSTKTCSEMLFVYNMPAFTTNFIHKRSHLSAKLPHLSPNLRPGALVVRFEVSDILELVDEDGTPEVERGGSALLSGDLVCEAPRAVDVVVLCVVVKGHK